MASSAGLWLFTGREIKSHHSTKVNFSDILRPCRTWKKFSPYTQKRKSLGCWHVRSYIYILQKLKYTPAVRSNILSKLIFASCLWYSDRAHYELCVLIKDIGRRLPLQLQCSYQGQQDDFSQSVRGNYKTRFWGGQNLTAVKGKRGPGFDQKRAGLEGGGGGGGGKGQFVNVSYKSGQKNDIYMI